MSTLTHERPENDRSIARFLAFGLAVIIGITALTARLSYLQLARGSQNAAAADRNRTVLQAIPSSRGLVYDRAGRPLVTNVPSFTVKIRPGRELLEERLGE